MTSTGVIYTGTAEDRRWIRSAASAQVIAVDAMSGDHGPEALIDGVALAMSEIDDARFLLFGDEPLLRSLLAEKNAPLHACDFRHCDDVVAMDAQPTQALRDGRATSMWRALDAVAADDAQAMVSSGNTGALMAMALVRLRTVEGVDRPAIAALWPSKNPSGFNVVLDVGANLRLHPRDLVVNAAMGAEYARINLDLEKPRVGLLNVGSEEIKGRAEVRDAAERLRIATAGDDASVAFTGFVEGDDISGEGADVVVTDGFTGNIALKTAEGAAKLIGGYLREALGSSWRSRLGAALAAGSLVEFKRRIDPRRVNGGVFLGLNGVVVKSHGSADAISFASALALAARMGRNDVTGRIAAQVAKLTATQHPSDVKPDDVSGSKSVAAGKR